MVRLLPLGFSAALRDENFLNLEHIRSIMTLHPLPVRPLGIKNKVKFRGSRYSGFISSFYDSS